MKKLLLLLGGVLLGAGLILGLVPMKAGGVDCGSVLAASPYTSSAACQESLSGVRAAALAVGGPGAVLFLLGIGTSSAAQRARAAQERTRARDVTR